MQIDSDKEGHIAGDEPDDLEAILTRLRKFLAGTVDTSNYTARILAALGIKKKSDSEMDEKEFQDAIAKKESEIETLREDLTLADSKIKVFEEKERLNYIKIIKKFGDKYSDEELEKKDLKSLEDTADAVTRFAPSNEKTETVPMGSKTPKEEIVKTKHIDFSRTFDYVRSEFDMGSIKTK